MGTNITELKFDDGQQVNIVTADQSYTFVTTALEMHAYGVEFEYEHETDGHTYRQFLPWVAINRIYQQLT